MTKPVGASDAAEYEIDSDRAEAISQAVLELPYVSDLDNGSYGEVAMLFPRRRVAGLREQDGTLEVHVKLVVDVESAGDIRQQADEIRAAARGALSNGDDRPIDVVLAAITTASQEQSSSGGTQ
ncbi:hypothetical protein KRX51_01545 [Corynebacterium sp. TAE3-ERU12]|uniref:hypothetical protein n=1 Tax=Corynebacterium sp. TAE3-ERU12 TaxID=2849491 RepID=UPI001C459B65|nr:hypothetical protein [Corynebacterium sp. TAE3-ERU12]MBV7294600.1 hypothetical protein [Corynebacterium sp. TAE3-ERU12]